MRLAASEEAESPVSPGWEDVHLIPSSLPEVSLSEVDLGTTFLGHRLPAPVVISSMTGGHQAALRVNEVLAKAAERLGLAIGVGSQRASIDDPSLDHTYAVVREHAPSALVMANLGACQLVAQGATPPLDRDQILRAVQMVDAQVLAIHLNVIEELIQTEGDRSTSGLVEALTGLTDWVPVPVMAKETGAGMTRESAGLLAGAGVSALDVGGAGGTSFARIEGLRAEESGDRRGARLGRTFARWGVPTVISILETAGTGLPVVATGGVRSGLDAAKAIALGAELVGIGRPALVAAQRGLDHLLEELELLLEELRVALVATGSRTLGDLRSNEPVLSGLPRSWVEQRDGG